MRGCMNVIFISQRLFIYMYTCTKCLHVYIPIFTFYALELGRNVACILYSLIFNVCWWMVYLCKFSVNIFCWRILVTYSLWLIYWGRYVLFFNFIKMLVKCTMFLSSWIYVHVIIWFNKFLIQTSLQFLFIN